MNFKALTVTATEMGVVLGLTDRRVRQLAEEGVFDRVERGRYPLAASVQAYIAAQEQDESDELRQERIALMKAQRRRIELDNASREATAGEFDFQDAVISVLSAYWSMNARRISTALHEELVKRPGMGGYAVDIAGIVHQWIIGSRVEIEDELKRAAAEGRKRGIGLASFDTLLELITKAAAAFDNEDGDDDQE
jgi:hypothetical protein